VNKKLSSTWLILIGALLLLLLARELIGLIQEVTSLFD
jgi:hypothetical protein